MLLFYVYAQVLPALSTVDFKMAVKHPDDGQDSGTPGYSEFSGLEQGIKKGGTLSFRSQM